MFVVTVNFRIHPGKMDMFLPLMIANARLSRETESGCLLFDVCRDDDGVFLYEVYEDRAAFDIHLRKEHFLSFEAAVASIVEEKTVRIFEEVVR